MYVPNSLKGDHLASPSPYMVSFVQLAHRFDFVAHAITGHSAARLAVVSKTSAAFDEATYYCNLAIQGLTRAINSFSRDNADAILCASLCLSNEEDGW